MTNPPPSTLDDALPHEGLARSPYYSPDMAPTALAQRRWGTWDVAALWISMAACVPTYMLGSSLIDGGMNWWQAILTVFIANVIVLVPMILNAHAGTKYGIPFPVYCRPAFGILGANVPAMLRALVACGWFGIQVAIGGAAIYTILSLWFPSWTQMPPIEIRVLGLTLLGLNWPQFGCFMFFWLINMIVVWAGINSIRILLNIKAPLLIVLGLLLLAWAYNKADGFGPMLSQPSRLGGVGSRDFWLFFFPALTANVGFWATLSLNIPDFTRYARSQKEQMIGQAIGLPPTMALFAFIGVAVTSATIVIYGAPIWDPVALMTKFDNKLVLVIAMFALCLATLATNIAANVVSPANDFAHLWPKKINFAIGGTITGVIGILMHPWLLIADPRGYIFKWLIAYSALLGAVAGVLIVDYYLIRRTRLSVPDLYLGRGGAYWYGAGTNWRAMLALVAGIAPCAPGFMGTVSSIPVAPMWIQMYHYAWFISLAVAAVVYWALSVAFPARRAMERAGFPPVMGR